MGSTIKAQTITCPECGYEFELTEAISKKFDEAAANKYQELYRTNLKEAEKKAKDSARKEVEEKYSGQIESLKNQVDEFDKLKSALTLKENELKEKQRTIDKQVSDLVSKKLTEAENKIRESIKKENSLELTDLQSQVVELQNKLTNAAEQELELRKKQRKLEEDQKTFELNKQRELDAARDEIYQKAKSESESDYELKIRDKDQKLDQLSKTVEELNKKLEQGSQQAQGESLEIELEELLKHNFPFDDIVPVAKGVKGADVIQKVKNQFGFECGTILWESKRHKRYDPKWVAKLKEDQRNEKANVSVLITQVLPDNISTFDLQDGVYIGSFNSSVGIASALREQLIQIQVLRQSEVGKNQKMESMYNYLTSHEFAQRISAILEAFEAMQKQVNNERNAFEKQWAAREKMLRQVIKNTSGLHGDLKGLIGASLPDIEALQLPESAESSPV
ncbi:MAG TPA: DUF2130 domain-containing protein, partial [Ignavibacteriaceae bacterium]|nr:DUF2130 domain-containing protein [Ignavibacteriaceae bacterium]